MNNSQRNAVLSRLTGIFAGLATHAVFFVTVWYVFWFLKGEPRHRNAGSLWLDAWLAVQFCIPHSLLLRPAVRGRIERYIPTQFYGIFYTLVTCACLLSMCAFWNVSPRVVWQFGGWTATLITTGYYSSWFLLLYSLSLTGLGYQTGWTPWWHWFRGRPSPPRTFRPRSLYRVLRHPVYVGFLGLLWFTPTVTVDRALLMAIWSGYIFLGSYFKDRRLEFYLGNLYRAYQAQVPGYPGFLFGPLGRIASTVVVEETAAPLGVAKSATVRVAENDRCAV